MSNNLSIKDFETMNEFVLVSFSDNTESIISLEDLRKNCPCADCAGETDALGNIYKGPPRKLNDNSYQITGLNPLDIMESDLFGKTAIALEFLRLNFLKNYQNNKCLI